MGRKIAIIRHGERLDFTYDNWLSECFTNGVYSPTAPSHPPTVPTRSTSFTLDSPLTLIGEFQGRLVGQYLSRIFKEEVFVVSSPALRCVQTAKAVIEGLSIKSKIAIEPSLFEYTGWFGELPQWMTTEELLSNGFDIDTDYKSLGYPKMETMDEFYARSDNVMRHLMEGTPQHLILLAHGISLETLTNKLMQRQHNKQKTMELIPHVPYCGSVVLEKNSLWKPLQLENLKHAACNGYSFLQMQPTQPFTHK